MSIPPKKTVYAASVQTLSLVSADTTYEKMLDMNLCYLDGSVDAPGWAQLYYNYGKMNLKKMAKYVNTLVKRGQNPFNDYIWINPEQEEDTDQDGLKQLLYNDYGVDDIVSFVLNPQYDEMTWVKYKLENYNWEEDNVVIDDITYTIKEYWFDDAKTIRVYLIDENENVIEKTVPAYDILDTSGDALVARKYLYIEYTTDTKHVDFYPLPYSGLTVKYVYTDHNGNSFDFTKKQDTFVRTLPLVPLKIGGKEMGWRSEEARIGEMRAIPKNSPFRKIDKYITRQQKKIARLQELYNQATTQAEKTKYQKKISEANSYLSKLQSFKSNPNYDLTGIDKDIDSTVKDYYKVDSRQSKLPKKAVWYNKFSLYPVLSKLCKKSGSRYESQMSVVYNTQCGFNDSNTSDTREQLYDCFWSYGVPMHAIKTTNVLTQPNSSYDSIIKTLEKDTKHPEVAQYAKYSRYTKDEIFESDKNSEGKYEHNHFAQIIPKKYKKCTVKAIAKYCFKYFDQFRGTTGGRTLSISQSQNTYKATHTWKQYAKKTLKGNYKYRYSYEWEASVAQTIYLQEITYTGKMKAEVTMITHTVQQGDYEYDTYEEFDAWQVHYHPIYMVKTYLCQVESDMDDEKGVYDKLTGIPIYAEYYKTVKDYDNKNFTEPEYELTDTQKVGAVLTEKPTLNITQKMLYNIKETDQIQTSNIMFAHGHLKYNITGYTTYRDWDRAEDYQVADHWETVHCYGYCLSKDKITTAIFDGDTVWVPLIKYYWKDLYYDDTYTTNEHGRKIYKWSDEKTLPPSIRTDLPYDNFTPSLFPEKGSTWIVIKNDDDWEGEKIVMKYYHKLNSFQYECIRVEDYNIDFVVNPYKGGQHKAGSLSCLAPDGNSFLPIVIPIINRLSFFDGYIITSYASKQYWSYWIKKVVKASWLSFFMISILCPYSWVLAATNHDSAWFDTAKAVGNIIQCIGDILSLNFLFKIFGLENTIFSIVVSTIVDIILTVFTAGTYLAVKVIIVVCLLICLAMSIVDYYTNKSMQQAKAEYDSFNKRYNDKLLEIQNYNNLKTIGLSTKSAAERVHRALNQACVYDVTGDLTSMLSLPQHSSENLQFLLMYNAPNYLVAQTTHSWQG